MTLVVAVVLVFAFSANAFALNTWDGSAATGFAGGTGTANDPYQIATGAQLKYLSDQTATNGNTYNGVYFKLTDDINLNNIAWKPIGGGNTTNSFKGHFDGNNKTISNIYYNETTGSGGSGNAPGNNVGLFGKLEEGASLKNLNMQGGQVRAQRSVGAFVGKSWGTITNCHNKGVTVYSTDSKGVGGIVGASWFNSQVRPTVSGCTNIGTVTAGYTGGVAGGIVGENEGPVYNCKNTGAISAGKNAGGIAGSNQSNNRQNPGTNPNAFGGITNCYNEGTVNATYAGGIAGYDTGSMENCYNRGTITGNINYTGDVIGQMTGTMEHNNLWYRTGTVAIGSGGSGVVTHEYIPTDNASKETLKVALNQWIADNTLNARGMAYKTWSRSNLSNSGYPYLY